MTGLSYVETVSRLPPLRARPSEETAKDAKFAKKDQKGERGIDIRCSMAIPLTLTLSPKGEGIVNDTDSRSGPA